MKNEYISLAILALLSLSACGAETEPAGEPIEEAPAVESPAEQEQTEEAPAEETPAEETPAEETPVEEESAEGESVEEDPLDESVPEGLETEMINEAQEADFEALAAGEYGEEIIYVTGTAAQVENEVVGGATFTLEAEEGTVVVSNMTDTEVMEGDDIVVYGTYGGEDEASGLPNIVATVITGVTE